MRMQVGSVQVGRVAPLGQRAVPSGFVKKPVAGRVAVSTLGLAGDEQADHAVHGGPEKAVYGYAAHHYEAWRTDFPEHSGRFVPGGMGENLTIEGFDEGDLCVGDTHRIGSALLQLCQPRSPCFKLALRFDDPRLPRAMTRNGRAGWYYRVLEAGEIGPGDEVRLVERPSTEFAFCRLVEIVSFRDGTAEEMTILAGMRELASALRAWAASRRDG